MELEFRSGVSFEGFWKREKGGLRVWTEREFINPDALGDLLDGPCYNPKVLEWKREEIGGTTADNTVSMRRLDTFICGCRPIGSVLSQIVSDLQKGGHHA